MKFLTNGKRLLAVRFSLPRSYAAESLKNIPLTIMLLQYLLIDSLKNLSKGIDIGHAVYLLCLNLLKQLRTTPLTVENVAKSSG